MVLQRAVKVFLLHGIAKSS